MSLLYMLMRISPAGMQVPCKRAKVKNKLFLFLLATVDV